VSLNEYFTGEVQQVEAITSLMLFYAAWCRCGRQVSVARDLHCGKDRNV